VEVGLDPVLLQIRLNDARRGVDRSARRLINDPIDVARRKFFLCRGRLGQHARTGTDAERGTARVYQKVAPTNPQSVRHSHAPVDVARVSHCKLLTPPWAANSRALFRAPVDTRNAPAPRPATRARWCESECARRRARGLSSLRKRARESRRKAA